MLIQILSHTPVYVWAILALLVYRGVIALRTREVAVRSMLVMPAVMLVLALQDILGKFGLHAVPLAAWGAGALAALALVRLGTAPRVAPGSAPGRVTVRGSVVPLLMMLAVFLTKYCASVALAVLPRLQADPAFGLGLCALFGVLSGYFLGRVAVDLRAARAFAVQAPAGGENLSVKPASATIAA